MAEKHGVLGAALLGAEVLDGAPVLSRHQLLGHAVAVKAGVAVLPPVLAQLVSEEQPAACKQEVTSPSTNAPAEGRSDQRNSPEGRRTVAAEVAVLVVDSLHLPGDLLDLAVLTQTRHEVGLLVLHGAVGAAEEHDLILHTHEKSPSAHQHLPSCLLHTTVFSGV